MGHASSFSAHAGVRCRHCARPLPQLCCPARLPTACPPRALPLYCAHEPWLNHHCAGPSPIFLLQNQQVAVEAADVKAERLRVEHLLAPGSESPFAKPAGSGSPSAHGAAAHGGSQGHSILIKDLCKVFPPVGGNRWAGGLWGQGAASAGPGRGGLRVYRPLWLLQLACSWALPGCGRRSTGWRSRPLAAALAP